MSGAASLSEMLTRSAGSTGTRAGHTVPLHYGSAAGELALCIRSVGLVNREDLVVLSLRGNEAALERITAPRLGDESLQVGEAASAGGIHWGRGGTNELLVAAAPEAALLLQGLAASDDELRVEAVELTAIGLVGPGTQGLLLDLGIYGSLAGAEEGGGRTAEIAGASGAWLLLDDSFALALVEPDRALDLWRLITAAGRRFELGYVGAEAAERFELTRCAPARPRRALL
jgi:hypothetical protein